MDAPEGDLAMNKTENHTKWKSQLVPIWPRNYLRRSRLRATLEFVILSDYFQQRPAKAFNHDLRLGERTQ